MPTPSISSAPNRVLALCLVFVAALGCADGSTKGSTSRSGLTPGGQIPPATQPPREYGACGNDRQPCCGGLCNNGIACTGGTCQARASCGQVGQSCCSANSCNGEAHCEADGRCHAATPGGYPGRDGGAPYPPRTDAGGGGGGGGGWGGGGGSGGSGGSGGTLSCGHDRQPCCRTGTPCLDGLLCGTSGVCAPSATAGCGDLRKPCCTGSATPCANGLECRAGVCLDAPACGGPRERCCATGTQCRDGMTCQSGMCATPAGGSAGGRGQRCRADGTCNTGLGCCGAGCVDTQVDARNCGRCGNTCDTRCERGVCAAACGGEGQACCADAGTAQCRAGLSCAGGRCQRPVVGSGGRPGGGGAPPGGGGGTPPVGGSGGTPPSGGTGGRPGAPAPSCKPAQETCTMVGECCTGLSCRGVVERPGNRCCQEAARTCTSSYDCCGSMTCDGGRCVCSGNGSPCSGNADCCTGFSCEAGVCTARVEADPCAAHADCSACAFDGENSCGWCASTNRCVSGAVAGPHTGLCDDWDWLPNQCGGGGATPCDSGFGTCNECTNIEACGWCPSTSSCVLGTADGPTVGGSTCADWTWLPSLCGGAPPSPGGTPVTESCGTATACYECASRPGCGWCGAECVAGAEEGAFEFSCESWTYDPNLCAPIGGDGSSGGSDPACGSESTCTDCLYGDCGWCGDTRTCMTGTLDGPNGRSCSDWTWYAGTCGGDYNFDEDNYYGPTYDACWSHTNCDACLEDPVCGWRGSTGECTTGSSAGPGDGSFELAWMWWNCGGADPVCTEEDTCDPDAVCAGGYSCDSCTSVSNCGWCPSTGTCLVGTYVGPTYQPCDDWQWAQTECWGSGDPDDDSGMSYECSTATTCDDCMYMATCGWCDGECVPGTVFGADEGACYDWAWTSDQCPGSWVDTCEDGSSDPSCDDPGGETTYVDPCASYDSCDVCTEVNGCGFCDGWCVEGDEVGSYYYWCDTWSYWNEDCG